MEGGRPERSSMAQAMITNSRGRGGWGGVLSNVIAPEGREAQLGKHRDDGMSLPNAMSWQMIFSIE